MLFEETTWLRDHALGLRVPNKRALNVGSGTAAARAAQPHVQSGLFGPLQAGGFTITHTDVQPGDGVDIVGDLTDNEFLDKLASDDYGLVLCTNVLEHVPSREALVNALAKLPSIGGYLLVTVPKHYPYHYDPVDTMFRPDVGQLSALFPSLEFVHGEVLEARRLQVKGTRLLTQRNYFRLLIDNPTLARLTLIRALLPFYKPRMWWYSVKYLGMMFAPFTATCVVLRRPDGGSKAVPGAISRSPN